MYRVVLACPAGLMRKRPLRARADTTPTARADAQRRADLRIATWLTLPPTPTLPDTTRSGHAAVNGTSYLFRAIWCWAAGFAAARRTGELELLGIPVRASCSKLFVTVMDTRGHGRSPVTSRSFSYGLFAEDVVGLLDLLKIPEISIVGWSDGAITGLQLAMTQPNKVSRLFAFGANSSVDGLNAPVQKPSLCGICGPLPDRIPAAVPTSGEMVTIGRWSSRHVADRTTLHESEAGHREAAHHHFRRRIL